MPENFEVTDDKPASELLDEEAVDNHAQDVTDEELKQEMLVQLKHKKDELQRKVGTRFMQPFN